MKSMHTHSDYLTIVIIMGFLWQHLSLKAASQLVNISAHQQNSTIC